MSKKTRIIKKARAELSGDARPIAQAKGPADVLAMIPYLVGFFPSESLVIVAIEGPRQRLGPCVRTDLADADDAVAQAEYLASVVSHHGFDPVIVVAYSEDPDKAAAVVQPLQRRLRSQGVTILELLRADARRWWSYQCADRACCGPGGNPYDGDSSPLAATAVLAGMAKAASRDELRACFEPGDELLRARVAECCAALQAVTGPPDINRLVHIALRARGQLTVDQLAALASGVQSIAARDVAWELMTRSNAAEHLHLWAQVTRVAPDRLLPAVGSLAGFAAWLSGSGVLASHAAERVERVHPTYSMNRLLLRCLKLGVNPQEWEDSRGRLRVVR
ncbi:MAG: DUF4192 domain-containing protein [Nocardioidaceae bacterium]|nr:DUF4192 domain-containing protein [Nocardioidaceae bacterium]